MKAKTDIDEHLLKNLETFRSIDTAKDWKKVRGQMGFKKQKTMRYLLQTAAAVMMLLGLGFLTQKLVFPNPDLLTAQAEGQMKEVQLPDGSRVTLNKEAKLTYPGEFNRRKRKLSLVGEAFFEVVSNPKKAFVVDVDQKALVQVLGTSFSISPDESGDAISVQVVEGRVAFSAAMRGADKVILEKDEQATLRAGTIVRADTIDMNFTSWKTGQLFFVHENIRDVFRELEDHYEIEILMHESIPPTLTFTSTMDNQDLESVLEEISTVLRLDYSYEKGKVEFRLHE